MAELAESDCFDLTHFAADAKALDAEAFASKHGSAFLVLTNDSVLKPVDGPRATAVADARRTPVGGVGPVRFHVWPIKKSSRSLISDFVSVGRTRRNDVVVPDVSLSKFHAFFVETRDGHQVQDARSRNGTFVNGVAVARQGDGPPMGLRSGAKVRFGAVELTYLDARGLRRLADRASD